MRTSYAVMNNISNSINEKRKLKLHNNKNHPICQLKEKIQSFFLEFEIFDELSELVSVKDNFDDLLISQDHPARSVNDTYYDNENELLRTHTSAHQNMLLKAGHTKFVITGDVYRKDTIDKTHYPVFHQMEVVKLLPEGSDALQDLKNTLSSLIEFLYPQKEYRFLDDYFPFTDPSIQVEVKQDDEWMEILGGGVIHPKILENCGIKGTAWAFGLGLDRLVLSFCDIPDIRLLWSNDLRFIKQFERGLIKFKPYSKYPPVLKDISFWVVDYVENHEQIWQQHNNFCAIIREIGIDLIENVALIDKFRKGDETSLAYRITFRSNDRTLSNAEINDFQECIRLHVSTNLAVTLR